MVEKLSKKLYSSHLFDVTQDIIGSLPLKLVEQWLSSEQTDADALQLLKRYRVKGYSVSSDSAGLTKLTQQKGLLEILAIIDHPKRIVCGYGKAISGEPVGIWAADNTQMFYPDTTDAAKLVSALLTIQDEIAKSCQIKIGLGAHCGEFYRISGGLYGAEADAIEDVAENHTAGGEILITQSICDRLPPDHNFQLELRQDLDREPYCDLGKIYRVLDGDRLSQLQPVNERYPIPYSDEFYQDLLAYEHQLTNHDLAHNLAQKYTQHNVVVLIESKYESMANHELAMFSQLSFSALMKDIGLRLLAQHQQTKVSEIKVISSLGIYVFDDPKVAVEFAQTFRTELGNQQINCRIGIEQGEVLIFELPVGTRDIAGTPVNVASKMAQDCGEFGKIYVSAGLENAVDLQGFEKKNLSVSNVQIWAYEG